MKQPKLRLLLIGLVLLMAIPLIGSLATAGTVKIITNASNSVETVDDNLVKNIFLGKKKNWPNGDHAQFVVLSSGETHKSFLQTYVKKSSAQFKNYWKKQVFTGKGKNPKSFASEGEIVTYVTNTPGTIGYVSAGTDIGDAKVLSEK
ncbi:MAG: substrate-binding domain-containing protein [Desulfobacterium sp.]|nr:substrate-binding domain-containing protein [Desulfobacterium sp.]